MTLCCEWGVYLRCAARRESFRLADLGGHPPWSVQKTKAGAIKCQGRLEGFYTHAVEPDMPQKWYNAVLPLLLATACVLTGVVCLSESKPAQPLWVWSALLAAATPLSWPLAGTLPTYFLSHRLSHSGCAVAGYSGAKAVSGAKRMVITDEDLYPAGTLSLNGMKIYGEELGRVLSYSVAMARRQTARPCPCWSRCSLTKGDRLRPWMIFAGTRRAAPGVPSTARRCCWAAPTLCAGRTCACPRS